LNLNFFEIRIESQQEIRVFERISGKVKVSAWQYDLCVFVLCCFHYYLSDSIRKSLIALQKALFVRNHKAGTSTSSKHHFEAKVIEAVFK